MILKGIGQQSRLRAQAEREFEQFLQQQNVTRSQQTIVSFAHQVTGEGSRTALQVSDQSEVIALLGGRTTDSYQLELLRLLVSPPL